MLQTATLTPPIHSLTATLPASLIDLLAGARRSLDSDPRLAHHYLDQISALIENPVEAPSDAALLAAVPPSAQTILAKGGLTPWQFARVRRHIAAGLDGTIPVKAMADVAQLSPGHFCRAFKVSIGETPHAFVIRQRLRLAQTLMLGTQDTLSQIACACGLTDQAHLTRLFRRMVGDTPLNWRRTWKSLA